MAVLEAIEPVQLIDLKKGVRIPQEIFELWMKTWDWTSHQIARGEFPEPFMSLDEFQLACICADPVLWVQCFLREPEDPDHKDPYGLWDYEKESLRYLGHTVHKCGSEVGKSREIIAYGLWNAFTVRNGSGLIGAPMQSHLDEIIEGMDEQLIWNLDLNEGRTHPRYKDGWKKHPHHVFYFTNGFKINFKPSGDRGIAYRGVHARTFAIKDESAKDKNRSQWSEFWRAVKPGCVCKIYSVPDGDRSCDFYKLAQRAIRTEGLKERKNGRAEDIERRLLLVIFNTQRARILGKSYKMPSAEEIYNSPPSDPVGAGLKPAPTNNNGNKEEVQIDSFKDARSHIKNIKFKLFQWSKAIMPYPYWSDERRKFYVEQYGGEDSPEYKHNVLGEDGDPEASVFPYEQLKYCIKDIPEYRCLKILVDSANNDIIVHGYKTEFVTGNSGPVSRDLSILDTVFNKAGFFDYEIRPDGSMTDSEFRKLIKGFFNSVPGLKRGGADFGYSGDPTEIIVKNIIGKKKRLVARLTLKHVTYDQQCQAIDALDDVFGPMESMSWGTDFGNAGSAVGHDLQGLPQYAHKNYDDRLKGFQFESTTDNIDENGEPIMDAKDGKPVKITLKELATDHMTKKIQRLESEYPPDSDIVFFYPNHTVSSAGKHRIYKKKDDHLIDADRAETLAEILGVETEDIFA